MIQVATDDFVFAEEQRLLAPAPRVRGLEWAARFGKNEDYKPYNHASYPHFGAPGGPWDAYDDPSVREIDEQFATRLGKSFFGLMAFMHTAATQPAPMMLGSSVEKLSRDVIGRLYKMMERCQPLSAQLLREDLRSKEFVELDNCLIYVGWARSPSTLGDKNVKLGLANEIDKWERASTSTEGDPLSLFLDRGKDFPNHKFILESTPSVKGSSRIEQRMANSSQSFYWVPCPHCRWYQRLQMNRIRWEKPAGEEIDIPLAMRSAHYVCEHCEGRVEDHQRRTMMRLGVWLPAGCTLDHERAWQTAMERLEKLADGTFSLERPGRFWRQPYVIGSPLCDSDAAGFQLSSLYATRLTWGSIAKAWLTMKGNPADLQTFINQWLGELWVVHRKMEEWRTVALRSKSSVPRYVAPIWSSVAVAGVDRQQDCYKYVVDAYGPGGRSHTMDYGARETLEEIYTDVLLRTYEHADGGTMRLSGVAQDHGGFKPDDVEELSHRCLSGRPRFVVMCCKGASTALAGPFDIRPQDKHKLYPGLPLILVDGNWSQGEIEKQLHAREPGMPGCYSVFAATEEEHEAFFRELLNEQALGNKRTGARNKTIWDRIDDEEPNDFRDCRRYGWTMYLIRTKGKPKQRVSPTAQAVKSRQRGAIVIPRITTPDGRAFLITERE